jgi:hypothetical protein
VVPHAGSVVAVHPVASLADRNGVSGVEIEIASAYAFPVRNNLLTLSIGSHQFGYSRYSSADLHQVVFSLTNAEFAQLASGDPITVHYGARLAGDVWNCGQLNGSR